MKNPWTRTRPTITDLWLPPIVLLTFLSCSMTLETTRQTDPMVRDWYLEHYPFDRFIKQIRAGKPVRGMNRDQLIASLSSPDIGYDYKTIGAEKFLIDVYEEKTVLFPFIWLEPEWESITTYYYFEADTLARIEVQKEVPGEKQPEYVPPKWPPGQK